MTLPRAEIEKGLAEELAAFSELVRPLTHDQLATPTRCAGWRVGDVAAHVAGTLADITAGRFEGLGTPEVTQRAVDERAGRTGIELADELDAVAAAGQALLAAFDDAGWAAEAPAGIAPSVGHGAQTLWYDAFVHADDIRHALGHPPVATDGALRASVDHLAEALSDQGWGPATLNLDGVGPVAVSGGGGDRTVTGDPMSFVLAATGRLDPADLGLDEAVNVYR